MAISTNGTVLARLAGGLYNTQMSNATYSEVKTLDPAALANTLYARDFASSTDLSVATTLVTNLGLTSVTGLANWVAAQLTAAGSANKGAKIVDLLNSFAQLTADTTYGAYATAFNTKVDAALVLSQTTGNAGGTFAAAGTPVNASFALTTGVDAFTGGSGDDVFTATETSAATWGIGDAIDGGTGNDTFNVTQTAAITAPFAATVKNIETVNLLSGATATSLNTTTWTGLTSLNATAPGAVTLTGAATTDITVTDSTQSNGAISVNGGKNVAITAATSVASAGTGGTVTVGGTTAAAGTVVVTESVTSTNVTDGSDATGGAIAVTGGSSVTVTQNIAGASVTTANAAVNAVGGAVSVTGNSSTTSVTVNQTAAVSSSKSLTAGVHGIKDGAVTIADANAQSSTKAGTITTATLKNYGDSTIDSNALTTVNLEGTGGTLGITTNSLTTAANTALALNVNGLSYKNAGTNNGITVDSDVKTLTITASTAASTIANVTASGATAVNVAGSANLTLTDNTFAAATAITVTNTASTTFGTTAIGAGVLFTGGAGAETITLSNSFTKAITMGGGNDTVTYGGAAGTGGSIDGGDGTDTIKMTGAQANAADANATFNSTFTGFEVLSLTTALDNANNTTINLAGIGGVSKVNTVGVGTDQKTLTLSSFASGGTLTITSDTSATTSGGITAEVTNATFNAADTFNIALSKQGVLAGGTVTVADVETVNISGADATTTASSGVYGAAAIHTLKLAATSAKSIVVTGNNGLNLTNTGNTAVTSFDASGVVGNDASTTDTAANLAVTFTGANTTTTAAVTIKGGAGNDVLTGSASKDTITGGAGGDIVNGGMGQDTINVGNGHDVIRVISDVDASAGAGVQSTTAAADIVNGFVLASAITTAVDLSTAAKFIAASTAGGANTSMLSIDLNSDGNNAGVDLVVAIEADATATAAQAVGATYTVKNGILSLAGSGASAVDTLAEWLVEAAAVAATDGETLAFVFGGDTYVFSQNAGGDSLVQLVGVAATSLVLASATTTVTDGAVIIGDSL